MAYVTRALRLPRERACTLAPHFKADLHLRPRRRRIRVLHLRGAVLTLDTRSTCVDGTRGRVFSRRVGSDTYLGPNKGFEVEHVSIVQPRRRSRSACVQTIALYRRHSAGRSNALAITQILFDLVRRTCHR